MKKIITLLLCAAMITVALASCTAEKKEEKPAAPNSDAEIETPVDDAEAVYYTHDELLAQLERIAPKKDSDKNVLVTAGGVEFSEAEVRYTVINSNYSVASSEEIAKAITDSYLLNASILNQANEMGIKISDRTFKEQIEGLDLYYKQEFGENFDAEFESACLTPYSYYLNQCYYLYYNEIIKSCIDDESSEFATTLKQTAFETIAPMLTEGNYIRAKHILVMFPEDAEKDENGNVLESAKAETLSKAEAILAEVNAMTDPSQFDALIEKYNEDPGMQSYPAGYYFTNGQMVEAFEEASYALEENATSGLVETPYGYHIIQRLPFDANTAMKSSLAGDQTFSSVYDGIIYNMLFEKAADYTIEYADTYDESVVEFTEDFNQLMAQQQEQAE